MRWYEKPAILDYIVKAYAGVDVVDGKQQRQFVWEEPNGDVMIGNTRAFTNHLAATFALDLSDTEWSKVHEALRAMGEVVRTNSPHTGVRGGHFRNTEPRSHVIRRGTPRKEEKE